jgi:hypothetical protein
VPAPGIWKKGDPRSSSNPSVSGTAIPPTTQIVDNAGTVWTVTGGKIVISKIKWHRILRIIWRAQPNRMGAALGVSVKGPMSGHPVNVRQSWAEGAKPDSMIIGRESGPAVCYVGGARSGSAT